MEQKTNDEIGSHFESIDDDDESTENGTGNTGRKSTAERIAGVRDNATKWRAEQHKRYTPNIKGATAKVTTQKAKVKKETEPVEEADLHAAIVIILSMLNTAAINYAGPDASMNTFERALIEPAMIRALSRGGEVPERVMSLVDPIALIAGLGMWGSRVYGVRNIRMQQSKLRNVPPPPSEPVATTIPNPNINGNQNVVAESLQSMQIGVRPHDGI